MDVSGTTPEIKQKRPQKDVKGSLKLKGRLFSRLFRRSQSQNLSLEQLR